MTKRFQNDLFGPDGYRTQIVHKGKRLEDLVPNRMARIELFRELDSYIRNVINDMAACAEMNWGEYAERRKHIGLDAADEGE